MDTALTRTVSFTLPWDDAPIDISFVFESEKPAGKHGFMEARGDKFFFEDGTEARFWGTNFNSAANFPSHEYSDMVAKRLAKFGLNIVRFHQLDGDWSTPNIFQFTKGKCLKDTGTFDPESMDRLDYLIFALKREGIYVYLDMLTYRRFREGDGVENAVELRDSARPQSNFDRRLIELQKDFCKKIWSHYNPYTKLAYKDDPAIVMTEITNENELFEHDAELIEPYRTQLQDRYLAWRKENRLSPVDTPVKFAENTGDIVRFKLEIQKAYFDEMFDYMRSIGVRIPITGTNWCEGGAGTFMAQDRMSFMDVHYYFYGWQWKPHEKGLVNRSYLEDRIWFRQFPYFRAVDRPFFISEWDEPWPNEYRAELTLPLAAMCALQGWSGTTIHTYRYDCRPNVDMIAYPITGEALSGVPYRSGIFDAFNDPARFGLFYHAALILRRGDVKESSNCSVVPVKELMTSEFIADTPPEKDVIARGATYPAFEGASELSKVGSALPSTKIPDGAIILDPRESRMAEDAEQLVSDTGEIRRNFKRRFGTIDSPRTKAAYGFLNSVGEIRLSGMTIRCTSPFCVIAASSLSDAPLSESDNILLSAVGRVDNTNAKYNDNHTIQYSKGHGPIEAEVIVAEIEIDTKLSGFRIDSINSNGMQVGRTPCQKVDGKLVFTIGGDFPSIYYLIQKI